MARSNSVVYNPTLYDLITEAYQITNIYDSFTPVSWDDMNLAVKLMNSMIKDWEAESIKLWKRKQGVLFLQKGQLQYGLGPDGDNATNSYVSNTLSLTAATSSVSISINTATITVGDKIGVKLDSGVRFWSTVSSITNSTTLVIASGLPSQATASNTVVSYTTLINRPMRILRSTVYDLNNGSEQTLDQCSYDEYFDMPNKNIAGRPNQAYYDKQLDDGQLYLFPNPNNTDQILKFTYQESLMSMLQGSNNFDFPQEWYHTILYSIACELLFMHQKFAELSIFQAKADALLKKAKTWDSDEETLSINIGRNNRK